jgi:hypothetical protein
MDTTDNTIGGSVTVTVTNGGGAPSGAQRSRSIAAMDRFFTRFSDAEATELWMALRGIILW